MDWSSRGARQALRSSANWGLFLAIVGFIFTGFLVLASLIIMAGAGIAGSSEFDMIGVPIGLLGFLYLFIAAMYFFPAFFLFRFAQGTKRALASDSSEQLEYALTNQSKMYVWMGVLVIIILSIYLLIFLFALSIGAAF